MVRLRVAKVLAPPSLCFTLLVFSVNCRPMVVLKNNKLFSGMLAAELQALEQTAQLNTYKAGRNVFQEGDPGDGLYIIVEGKVQITCLVGQDQRRVLSRLGAGDFFGEMAVLDNQPRSATATAETDTQVYFILRDPLLGPKGFENPRVFPFYFAFALTWPYQLLTINGLFGLGPPTF